MMLEELPGRVRNFMMESALLYPSLQLGIGAVRNTGIPDDENAKFRYVNFSSANVTIAQVGVKIGQTCPPRNSWQIEFYGDPNNEAHIRILRLVMLRVAAVIEYRMGFSGSEHQFLRLEERWFWSTEGGRELHGCEYPTQIIRIPAQQMPLLRDVRISPRGITLLPSWDRWNKIEVWKAPE